MASNIGLSSSGIFRPTNMIDLTKISTIKINHVSSSPKSEYNAIKFGVIKILPAGMRDMTPDASIQILSLNSTASSGLVTLDVSSLSGSYYVYFQLLSNITSSPIQTTISQILLE